MTGIIDITNLGECSGKELIDIRDNIEEYFPEYSSTEHTKIKELFKLVIRDEWPPQFKLDKVCMSTYEDKLCFKNSYNQVCYEENDILECMPIFYKVDGEEFKFTFTNTRHSLHIARRWRVSNDYTEDDYKNFDNYITEDNSTVSIHDHDIISVCTSGGFTKGKHLLKFAVENGGKKLDAYSGLYNFYTSHGFIPIAICKWEDEYAPEDWKLANQQGNNCAKEDIVFYIYTGEPFTLKFTEWLNQVEYSKDYDEAKSKRDLLLRQLMEEK